MVCDTEMFAPDLPTICVGLRGMVYYELLVEGANHDLHSGVYGGAAPNPMQAIAEILTALKDRDGHIQIPGFYDRVSPPSDKEREAWARLPFDEKEYTEKEMGARELVGEPEVPLFERLWARPTLEVHGIRGGFTGEGAKTVIPSKAYAKFSTRLVPNQDPHTIAKLVEKHIRKFLPKTVKCKFDVLSTGKPWVAPFHAPIFKIAQGALEKGFGKKAVFIREGGSIPFVTQMHDTFKVPCVLIGFGLPDENAHAPDEHLALENYFGGIKAIAHFYTDLARALTARNNLAA